MEGEKETSLSLSTSQHTHKCKGSRKKSVYFQAEKYTVPIWEMEKTGQQKKKFVSGSTSFDVKGTVTHTHTFNYIGTHTHRSL